jgi:hypothetical protein
MKEITKICCNCDRQFTTEDPDVDFCSEFCYDEYIFDVNLSNYPSLGELYDDFNYNPNSIY